MGLSFLDHIGAGIARFAAGLFREMAPKILFFFTAFMLIFLLFKLWVAEYSIEFSAFTTAAIAALVLGKLVSLLERAQARYNFEEYRPIVVIAGKTVVYALFVMLFRAGERFFGLFRKEQSLGAAFHSLIAGADAHRFFGLLLLISMVVGAYLTVQEIDRAMGKGNLFRVLFERPRDALKPPHPDRTKVR